MAEFRQGTITPFGLQSYSYFSNRQRIVRFFVPRLSFFLFRRKAGLADTQAVHGKSIPTSHRFGNTLTARNRRYGGRGKRVRRPSYGHHHGRHTRVRRPPYPHPESGKAKAICRRSACLRACLHHESAVRPPGCKTFGTTLRVFSKNVVTLQAQEFDNHKLFIQ